MANNNINLKFISEDSQLDKSLKKLGSIEGRIKKLVSAEQKGQITTQQFNKRIATLATEFQRVSGGSIAARNSLFKFSREVYQSSKATDQLADSTNRLSVASKNAASHVQVVGKRANRTGVLAQQAGYQFGDFAVQVQSGTSPLIAFSQQATQLIGTFSMLATSTRAIMAFSALGVIVPVISAVAGAIMRARGESKGFEEQLSNLKKLTDDLKSSQDLLTMSTEALSSKYGKAADSIKAYALLKAQIESSLAREEIAKAVSSLKDNAKAYYTLQDAGRSYINTLDDIVRDFKVTTKEAKLLESSFTALAVSESFDHQKGAIQDLLRNMKILGVEADELPRPISEMVLEFIKANENAAEAEAIMRSISKIDIAAPINLAAQAAKTLSTNLAQSSLARNYMGREETFRPGAFPPRLPTDDEATTPKGSAPRDALLDLQKRIALDTKLLGVSREQAQVERAIANSKIKYSDQEIANTVKELEVYNLKLARIKETQALYGTVQSSLESGFMAMVDGTKSVEDAFKDMAKSVIAELYRVLVVKRMVGSFEAGTGIMGFLGGIFGKASGGTVMSGTPYLVGEKGPELIVPQNRGHVMNADLTDKAMNGSKGETVVVNQTINVSTGVQQTVRSEIKQLMPQIAQSAKSAVVDAKRRGGSYGRAFS